MAFEHDVSLVTRALEVVRQEKAGWQKRNRINALIEELRIESRLANGPVPERSDHWQQQALMTQLKLRQELES